MCTCPHVGSSRGSWSCGSGGQASPCVTGSCLKHNAGQWRGAVPLQCQQLRRLGQENCVNQEFKASLGHTARPQLKQKVICWEWLGECLPSTGKILRSLPTAARKEGKEGKEFCSDTVQPGPGSCQGHLHRRRPKQGCGRGAGGLGPKFLEDGRKRRWGSGSEYRKPLRGSTECCAGASLWGQARPRHHQGQLVAR